MKQLEKVLRGALITGIFAVVVATPFIVSDSLFFPFIVGKAVFFRVAVTLLVGIWIVLMAIDRTYWPRFSWITAVFTAFVVWIGIANIFGMNPIDSLWSNFERMEGYVMLLYTFAFFLVTTSVVTAERLWNRLLQASLFAAFVVGILALSEYFDDGGRVAGLLGNPIYLGGYMLFHVFLATLFMLRFLKENMYYAVIYGTSALFFVLIVILTGTRGAMLGLIGGFFVIALALSFRKDEKRWIRYTARTGLVAATVAGLFLASVVAINNTSTLPEDGGLVSAYEAVEGMPVVDRFSRIDLSDGDAQARFLLWGIAIDAIAERPFMGWGQENYTYPFNEFYKPSLFEREEWFDRAHNIFLEWGVAGGVLGLVLYLALFGVVAVTLWRTDRLEYYTKAAFMALFLAYAIHNFFVFDNITSYVFLGLLLAFVAVFSAKEESNAVAGRPLPYALTLYAVAPLVVLVSVSIIYAVHINMLETNKGVIHSIAAVQCSGQLQQLPWGAQTRQSYQAVLGSRCERFLPDDVGSSLGMASEYSSRDIAEYAIRDAVENHRVTKDAALIGGQEIVEQFSVIAPRVLGLNIGNEVRDAYVTQAEESLLSYIDRFPNKLRPHSLLGRLYSSVGRYEEARDTLYTARELAPRRQHTLLQLGEVYTELGEHEAARDVLKEAHELEPSFNEPRLLYAASLRFLGEEEKYEEVVAPLSDREILMSEELLKPLMELGEYEEVVSIRRERIELYLASLGAESTDGDLQRIGQEYLRLAETYYAAGDDEAAAEAMEELAENIPDFRGQAEQIIERIRAGEGVR